MFSGIVQEIGVVDKVESQSGISEITIGCNEIIKSIKPGDSVSVNGCCQTVVLKNDKSFSVQATDETLQKTNFQKLQKGSKVNLEDSLRLGDKICGHLVSGHVDDSGIVSDILSFGENKVIKISFPKKLSDYIAAKGSVSVNGVSLTVIDSKDGEFNFTLIPFTRDNTNLGNLKIGDHVNLEVDIISRYVVNCLNNNKALVGKV